jgi:hypothetical protein
MHGANLIDKSSECLERELNSGFDYNILWMLHENAPSLTACQVKLER